MQTIISNNENTIILDKKGKRGDGSTKNAINIIENLMKESNIKLLLLTPNFNRSLYIRNEITNRLNENIKDYFLDKKEWKDNMLELYPRISKSEILFKTNTISLMSVNPNIIYKVRGQRFDYLFILDIDDIMKSKLENDILENVLPAIRRKVFLEFYDYGKYYDYK